MIVLTIKTDNPKAEIGVYSKDEQLAYEEWEAHTVLTKTITQKINRMLRQAGISMNKVEGIVLFEGPGSFTGLRIGAATANTLAYAQSIPIIGIGGNDWIKNGIKQIGSGKNQKIALPKYGGSVKTTMPRK